MHYYSANLQDDDVYHGHRETSLPLTINCCGYIRFGDFNVALERTRMDSYLIYLINGLGHYRLNDEYQTIDAGNIVLYRPGSHQDYFYRADEHTELYWIHFSGTTMEQMLDSLGFMENGAYKVGIHADQIQLFERIIQEVQLMKPHAPLLCIGYLIELLSVFARATQMVGCSPDGQDTMDTVIRSMNVSFDKDIPIGQYAEMAGMNAYRFIRQFRKATMLSPVRYIEKLRMAHAKELLCNSMLTVSEISGIVGYNDPFYFCRVFRKNAGSAPSRFREEARHSKLNSPEE